MSAADSVATALTIALADEAATVSAGKLLGQAAKSGATVFLEGQLGAGKTTLCRGVLQAFDYSGAVKSPTYTLVEPYEFSSLTVYHFDLYRLGDPEELEFMGIRDYFDSRALCLVEWPSKGEGILPHPDLTAQLEVNAPGRQLTLSSGTQRGREVLSLLASLVK